MGKKISIYPRKSKSLPVKNNGERRESIASRNHRLFEENRYRKNNQETYRLGDFYDNKISLPDKVKKNNNKKQIIELKPLQVPKAIIDRLSRYSNMSKSSAEHNIRQNFDF